MTIDEIISHARRIAKVQRCRLNHAVGKDENEIRATIEIAEEYEHIAEWLEELKDYRSKNKFVVRVDVENMDSIKDKIKELSEYAESQYSKAIDDVFDFLKTRRSTRYQLVSLEDWEIEKYKGKLKAGGTD